MAAAAVWKSNVLLTDLEEIQENLLFNIKKNQQNVGLLGWISGDVLDWTKPQEALPSIENKEFEVSFKFSLQCSY